MALNQRNMLPLNLPGKFFNLTIFIPCFQKYPPPPPPPPPQRDLSYLFSTSIYVIGSVLLFLLLVVLLYLHITQLRRRSDAEAAPGDTNQREDENEAEDRNFSSDHYVWRINTVGLHRSVINSITVVRFKKEEGIIDGTDCSICLTEFEEDDLLRLLPNCSHAFHITCIDTWLLSHKNCPLCRTPILLTKPPHQKTETSHVSVSGSSNDNNEEPESSGSRNSRCLSRVQSDSANHCGSGSLQTVRRSFSIGGSSTLKDCHSDDSATRSKRHFYSSFSANFLSSSRRSRNQDPVLPIQMPHVSD